MEKIKKRTEKVGFRRNRKTSFSIICTVIYIMLFKVNMLYPLPFFRPFFTFLSFVFMFDFKIRGLMLCFVFQTFFWEKIGYYNIFSGISVNFLCNLPILSGLKSNELNAAILLEWWVINFAAPGTSILEIFFLLQYAVYFQF